MGCDEVHMLRGWSLSRDARTERAVAEGLDIKITGAKE
jgi:hypothetical protein